MWMDVAVHENSRSQPFDDHVQTCEAAVWRILAIAQVTGW